MPAYMRAARYFLTHLFPKKRGKKRYKGKVKIFLYSDYEPYPLGRANRNGKEKSSPFLGLVLNHPPKG